MDDRRDMMRGDFVDLVMSAIEEAEASGLASAAPGLTGYSGEKVIGLLQRLAQALTGADDAYLEVGVFQGLTLLSVAHAVPDSPVFGIDDFSQFDLDGTNRQVVEERRDILGARNSHLVDLDYEVALGDLAEHIGSRKVAVYFVDGPHDYRSQLMCLELARPYFADHAAIVVDDSNYEHVRQANADFLLSHPEYALAFEAYSKTHPSNLDAKGESEARGGWWNGINVLVRDPAHRLERIYPPTSADRTRYVNEHIVHSERNGDLAPQAVALVDALLTLSPIRFASRLLKLRRAAKAPDRVQLGAYEHCNIRTHGLGTRRAALNRPESES